MGWVGWFWGWGVGVLLLLAWFVGCVLVRQFPGCFGLSWLTRCSSDYGGLGLWFGLAV